MANKINVEQAPSTLIAIAYKKWVLFIYTYRNLPSIWYLQSGNFWNIKFILDLFRIRMSYEKIIEIKKSFWKEMQKATFISVNLSERSELCTGSCNKFENRSIGKNAFKSNYMRHSECRISNLLNNYHLRCFIMTLSHSKRLLKWNLF